MAHHDESQVAQHLLAAVAHGIYLERFADPERDPVWQAMWLNRPPVRDRMVEIIGAPGPGINQDWKMVENYRVAQPPRRGWHSGAHALISLGVSLGLGPQSRGN